MSQLTGDKPVVSELRFRRLLESPDIDALFTGLRRALPLIGYRCDPLALATDVVNWGDVVRKRWAYGFDWPDRA
jgi:CRISPR system Cascade subunit CasB